MEGLPGQRRRPLQADDAQRQRVHPPLPDPRPARRVPPYPPLRPARQRQSGRQYRVGSPPARRTRSSSVNRPRRWRRRWPRTRRVERLSLLWRAHNYHRDLRTRLPAAAVASPSDRARQFMTVTPLSPSPITASVRRRYLTGTGHASPKATVSAAFGRQNLQHRLPDHQADRTRGDQTQRPPGRSTVVLSETHRSDQAAATNSP